MRLLQTVACATALLTPLSYAASIPSTAHQAFHERSTSIQERGEMFSSAKGRTFDIDGKIQYFAGTNAWWLGHLTSDDDLEVAMSEIAEVWTCPLLP